MSDRLGHHEIINRPSWAENDSLLRLARHSNVWVKFTELYTASKTKYISTEKRFINQAAAAMFFSYSARTLSNDFRDQRNA